MQGTQCSLTALNRRKGRKGNGKISHGAERLITPRECIQTALGTQELSYLSFKDEQPSALNLCPRLSSTSPSLTEAVALYAILGFSQDSQTGDFLGKKTLNPGFFFLPMAYFSP